MRLSMLAALFAVVAAEPCFAQDAPAEPSGATVGFMHAIHATNRVDETLAFYTEVFGLAGQIRAFENPGVPLLTNAPGVTLRVSMLRIPGQGFNFELTEFQSVERHPAAPSIVDPGAAHMKLLVRDLDPVVAALDARGAEIVTRSGAPVRVSTELGSVEAIFCRDPDGYLVEAIEVPFSTDAGTLGNVVGSIMGLTVEDMNASLAFWRDLLGFELGSPKASTDPAMLDLFGIKGRLSFVTASGVVPGSNARIELIEFRDVPRRPFDLRVPDPGASGMAIRVADIETLLPRLAAAGVRVISKDGRLVEWSPTVRNVFVKDPNGFNIELVGQVEAR
jgi:catechol 2,3-dioxygenase-like lactoylglutathione lyase family enzyme